MCICRQCVVCVYLSKISVHAINFIPFVFFLLFFECSFCLESINMMMMVFSSCFSWNTMIFIEFIQKIRHKIGKKTIKVHCDELVTVDTITTREVVKKIVVWHFTTHIICFLIDLSRGALVFKLYLYNKQF